jgi:ribonuclease P protein component
LLRAGQRLPTRRLEAKRLDSAVGHVRVAIVVPKFSFTIVRRNKLKRRLRELARLHVLPRDCSCDLVIRARRESYDATFDGLRDEIQALAAQLA